MDVNYVQGVSNFIELVHNGTSTIYRVTKTA